MSRILTIFLLLCLPVLQSCQRESSAKPLVISTIKPIQALVYAVAGGNGGPLEIRQLLPDGASPHHFALKPSDMRSLENAQIIFRIGSGLETFLDKPLANLPATTQVIDLSEANGVNHLYSRSAHADAATPGSADTEQHNRHNEDLHIWLNPQNAIAMSHAIDNALSAIDPAHAAQYHTNTQQLIQQITTADAHIRQQLAPFSHKPYLSFHDAWQHFDSHYGLSFAGAVTLDASRLPGARHIWDIRKIIEEKQAVCLFQEPQFSPALVKTLVEGTGIKLGELDPLGMQLPLNGDTYITLLQTAANAFQKCLEDKAQ